MSDSSDELLSKADALLSRWRSGVQAGAPPADYPVLTEVVQSAADPASSQQRLPEHTGEQAPAVAALGSTMPVGAIESRIRQRVLKAIEPAITDMVANRVRGRLEDAARRIAGELSGQISEDIAALVREAVHHALERELAALRADEGTGSL